ncbi:hypothetical protein AMTRI_Chr05g58070 [Amborella trichopoda]
MVGQIHSCPFPFPLVVYFFRVLMLLLSFGPSGKRETLDALKERVDSLTSKSPLSVRLQLNGLKHFRKEFFDSNFHMLLTSKKNKFVKGNRWFPRLEVGTNLTSMAVSGIREELLAMGACSGIVLVTSSGPFIGHCDHVLQMRISFGFSTMEPVNLTTLFKRSSLKEIPSTSSTRAKKPASTPGQWTHLWDRIDRSLHEKVSFIHVHRENNGCADVIAKE